MSIPSRLANYLEQRGAHYDICAHEHSRCSAETARAARVPAHQLAKSVIVEDDDGCVMAVVPADRNNAVRRLRPGRGARDRHGLEHRDRRR
ncbi:hypothetical protein SBBP2_320004 [Burkholderiales bacterium]|nr:hypothetical protein SBBP2_320004 [Burkholderiales bacterium]